MSKAAEPCPFCGTALRRVVSKARSFQPPRDYIEWQHDAPPVNCYLYNMRGTVVASTGDDTRAEHDFLEAWNRRTLSSQEGLRKALAEYEAFVERCNRITDRDIEEAEFRRFIEAERARREGKR